MSKPTPGECQFCKGTPELPGKMPVGMEFAFLDEKGTRCNKPGCVLAWGRSWDKYVRDGLERQKLIRKVWRPGRRRKWRAA